MSAPKISGLNHVTLAVGDLARSILFYRDVLGFRLRAEWTDGAYLEAGSLWLCLSVDPVARTWPHPDYTHIALDVAAEDFDLLAQEIRDAAVIWKENSSEGPSLYFLDPDGHKLELHVGSLASRLAHYRAHPVEGRKILDP
jgi:catechol 2,3-dioxygenase-like lactoylglutathione lyase family enzyme